MPSAPYFVKFDLSEAFYHVTLHRTSRRLTTFRIDGNYYHFVRLPFGIWTAPFVCQMLINGLTHHLHAHGLWAWGHIGNVLLAHSDPLCLHATYDLSQLASCGFRLNPKDTTYKPSHTIQFLRFELNGINVTIVHFPDRVTLVHRLLLSLRDGMPLSYFRHAAGLLAFYLSLHRTRSFLLRPLYAAVHYQPICVNWAPLTSWV